MQGNICQNSHRIGGNQADAWMLLSRQNKTGQDNPVSWCQGAVHIQTRSIYHYVCCSSRSVQKLLGVDASSRLGVKV